MENPLSRTASALTRNYRLIDYLTQGYIAAVALLILLFYRGRLPGWPLHVLAHAVVLIAVHALVATSHRHPRGLLNLLRHFYPVILYTFLYRETGALDHGFVGRHLDPFFLSLEERIFGCQPALLLMAKLPYLWVSECMYASYFSYFLMVPGVGLALYLRDREQFMQYLTAVSLIFYICYLTYIFLPVAGPRILYESMPGVRVDVSSYAAGYVLGVPEAVSRGPFFTLMALIYRCFEPEAGAAFPSSHVAVAAASLFFSWRYLKGIRHVHLLLVILLAISTVYCRYHYVVDVLGGIGTALVLVPTGNLLYRKVDRRLIEPQTP